MDDSIFKTSVVSREAHLRKQLPPVDLAPWHPGQLEPLRRSGSGIDCRRVALHRAVAAVRVQVLPAALHHIGIKALCGLQQGADGTGQQQVIAVHEHQPAPHGMAQPFVAGGGGAAGRAAIAQHHPGQRPVAFQHGSCAVGGIAVHHDQLHGAAGLLLQNAVQTRADGGLAVIHRHDDRKRHRRVLRRQRRAGLLRCGLRAQCRQCGTVGLCAVRQRRTAPVQQVIQRKVCVAAGGTAHGGSARQQMAAGAAMDQLISASVLDHASPRSIPPTAELLSSAIRDIFFCAQRTRSRTW